MSKLKRNYSIVWEETTHGADMAPAENRRYVALAHSHFVDGESHVFMRQPVNYSWGIYDLKDERFLRDREVRKLSEAEIREPLAIVQ